MASNARLDLAFGFDLRSPVRGLARNANLGFLFPKKPRPASVAQAGRR
jgi:hypothetical protein